MKRAKAQPSVVGLLLIVAGMILLSTLMLILAGNGTPGVDNRGALIGLTCAAVLTLGTGSALSARRRRGMIKSR